MSFQKRYLFSSSKKQSILKKSLFFLGILFGVSLSLVPEQSLLSVGRDPFLTSIYEARSDLQKAFDQNSWNAFPESSAGFLIDLQDWAQQYGWREYPHLLDDYAPVSSPPLHTGYDIVPSVSAHAYSILDRKTGMVLAQKNSTDVWPIASLTKLMTASVVLDRPISLSSLHSIEAEDEVGGARLSVYPGTTYTTDDLLYATLVASANNAARALSHATDLSEEDFILAMNTKAQELGMPHTHFVESSGIETENVSTAREMARLAMHVFANKDIRRYTTTASKSILSPSSGIEKKITSTNWMLWKPTYNDLYVMSGKTGYLNESKWNFVVSLRQDLSNEHNELLLVVFGADSRADSFADAHHLANWAWDNFVWSQEQVN